MLIYLYRSSVPGYDGGDDTFATIIHAQAVTVFFASLAAAIMMDDDDDQFSLTTVPTFWMVLVLQQDGKGLYSVWWLVFTLLYWNAFSLAFGAGVAVM